MKNHQICLYLLLAMMTIALVSCSSDSDSPTTPSTADVDGVWEFLGQLTQNTCELDTFVSIVANIRFEQSGTSVRTPEVFLSVIRGSADLWTFIYAGTVTGNNVSMAAVDPYTFEDGGTIISFGSGIEIQNINATDVGEGSLNLTGTCIQGCSGSCQTVWTGIWEKDLL